MSRFIDFWEGYEMPTTDYINEYLSEDDAVLKGKYNFSTQKLKFSGKVKFNTASNGALETSGDYSITHKPWYDSNYMVFHKSRKGETSVDGHFWLAEKKNFNFQLYLKECFLQTADIRQGNMKAHLRTIHPNFIFSFGFENLNVFNLFKCQGPRDHDSKETSPAPSNCLPNLSIWSLGGRRVDPKLSLWGGLGLSFNPNKKNLDNVKILGVANQTANKIKASVEGTFTRNDGIDSKSLWIPSVRVLVDSQALSNNRQLASVEYDLGRKSLKWNLVNETRLDNATRLKVRLNQDYGVSAALIHSFSNLANFALTANISHKVHEEGKLGYLRYKFGSSLEFLDV